MPVLTVLIVVFLAAASWRGWLRGIFVETFDLVALALVVIAAAWVWRVAGPGVGVASLVGGAVAVLVASRPIARAVLTLPRSVDQVSRIAGSLFAGVWAILLTTAVLLVGTTTPGARARVAGPVCGDPLARYLTVADHPLHTAGERLARLGRPVMVWASRQLFDTFTLTLAADGRTDVCVELDRSRDAADAAASMGPEGFTFPAAGPDEVRTAPDAETEVLALLNRARADAGLPPLDADPSLAEVGRAHAVDMYVRGYFAHDTPECEAGVVPGCRDPFNRMHAAGITYATAGENLALAPSARAAHEGLMGSPGHRANILDPRFRRVGIGVVDGPFGLMVTQEFAG